MTRKEYYAALKRLHDKTNWNNRQSVKAYNERARELRKQISGDSK